MRSIVVLYKVETMKALNVPDGAVWATSKHTNNRIIETAEFYLPEGARFSRTKIGKILMYKGLHGVIVTDKKTGEPVLMTINEVIHLRRRV